MPFQTLTEATSVVGWIAPQLGALLGKNAVVRHCEVLHARRRIYAKPTSAHRAYVDFCYRLGLHESGDGTESTEILYGRGYQQRPSDAAAMTLGQPAPHPDLHVFLRRFPDDPGLPSLPELTGALAIAHLPDAAKRWLLRPAEVRVEVISYRPGERCVLRLSPAASGVIGLARRPSVYAKCYSLGLGARVAARYRALEQSVGGASLPEMLHFDEARDVLWLAGIEGPLAADHCDGTQGVAAARQIASVTAELHSAPVHTEEVRSREVLIDETGKRIAKLALALPTREPALAQLGGRLLAAQAYLPAPRYLPIHGDLHLRQWVMADGHAYLVDLDELASGEAEQDLASLIVDMEYRRYGRAPVAALLLSYAEHAKQPIDRAVLDWHYRLQLIAKAYRLYWRGGATVRADMLRLLGNAISLAEFKP